MSGSGILIAISESQIHRTVQTVTKITTWSSTTTYLTTFSYTGAQASVVLVPKANLTSGEQTMASGITVRSVYPTEGNPAVVGQMLELTNLELRGDLAYGVIILIVAAFLLILALARSRRHGKIRR